MAVPYHVLLRRAARLAAHHPQLWALGFLLSASGGGGAGDLIRVIDRDVVDVAALAPYLAAVAAVLVLLALFFLLAAVLAEGALIHAVREIEAGRPASLHAAALFGLRFYLRLFLLFVVLFVVLSALLVPLVWAPIVVWKLLGSGAVVTVLLVLALAPPYVFFALGTIFAFAWAPRLAVLDDMGAFGAFRETLRTLARDPSRTMGLSLGALVNEMIALTLLCLAAFPFAIVAALLYLAHPLLVVIPAIPFIALLLVYLGLKGTFTSAYWTLAAHSAGRARARDLSVEAAGGI